MTRFALPAFLLLTLLALLRIASTYHVFNNMYDENAHVGAGMEYVDRGTYNYEAQHPPMRAVYAIGPYLLGIRSFYEADWGTEGTRILYADGKYWRNLIAARVAALPFFLLAMGLVFVWTRRLAGPLAAVLATLAYSTLPLVLGHAGLVGNDTLLAGMLTLALFAWAHWLARPDWKRAVLFGLAASLALVTKLSALMFLAAIVGATGLLWLLRVRSTARAQSPVPSRQRVQRAAGALAITAVTAFLVIWTTYRFSFGPLTDPHARPHNTIDRLVGSEGAAHDAVYALMGASVPAPEFWLGIDMLRDYNRFPPASYFMGEINERGFPAFFPVGILIRTPVPFLLLMFAGIAVLLRRAWRDDDPFALVPPVGAILILLACLPAGLNIGVRHVLPMFPLLAIGAGVFAAAAWQVTRQRVLVRGALIVLLGWQLVSGVRAHPDYLAYFNECCEAQPQRWLINSDLDWGQDLQRLSDELHRRSIDKVSLAYFGTADLSQHGLPAYVQLKPYERVHGWVAASEFRLGLGTYEKPYDQYRWLLQYQPVARVGKSIRLYWIP